MISVIIPAHNEEDFLPRLLQSLKAQKYLDFEVIVSDDCSSDNTVKLARKQGIRNLRIVSHKNRNTAIARNRGAAAARGDILVFMDADTYVDDSSFLAKISGCFRQENVGGCSVNVKVYPEEENSIDRAMQWWFNLSVRIAVWMGIFASRGECQAIRKKVFRKIGGYNPNIAVAEDVEIFKRVQKTSKTVFVNSITVFESPRRYRKVGYPRVVWEWCYNGIHAFVFGKSITKEWKPVR